MPEVALEDGVRLRYVERGEGDETVVLSHSYLVDHRHFDRQIEALAARYRVLAYDHRGHGQSDRPTAGYSMERIYADGVAFVEAIGGGPVHWIGLSTGGFVGMRMAFRRPELLKSLVLMDTSSAAEPLLARIKYQAMFGVLRTVGLAPVLGATMQALFGRAFLRDPARQADRDRWRARLADNHYGAIIGFGKAIFARDDVTHRLGEVAVPTLVVVGEDDVATPPRRAIRLTAAIPNARLAVIARAGHLCTVEEPAEVNRVLLDFLSAQSPVVEP